MKILTNRIFHFALLAVLLLTLLFLYQAKEPFAKQEASFEELPIAIVNTEEVFLRAKAFQDVQKQIEGKANALQQENTKKQEQLQAKHKKIESQKAALSDKALEEKITELNKEFEDINKAAYMQRLVIDRAYKNALTAIDAHFVDIINAFADDKGLKVVFNKSNIIYSDESMNITDVIVEKLDKKISSYKVNFKDVEAEVKKSIAQQEQNS